MLGRLAVVGGILAPPQARVTIVTTVTIVTKSAAISAVSETQCAPHSREFSRSVTVRPVAVTAVTFTFLFSKK